MSTADWLIQIAAHTPVWVYFLFVYLISRGIAALKPGEITPLKLAIVPALFTIWGVHDLVRLYGFSLDSIGPWLVALAVGCAIGWLLVRASLIGADRARGIIHRPADYTVLPLIVLAFGFKYAFGVIARISPELLAQPNFRLADLAVSGLLAGIFVGKFARYMARYLAAPVAAAAAPR